jgi:hypothetical protein
MWVIEQLVYYLFNVCTLGVFWVIKILLKKAFYEALTLHDEEVGQKPRRK